MDQETKDPRLHFVVATAIVEHDGKYLIAKRAPHEKAFPDKWTVPGGKLVRPDGFPVVTLSYGAKYKSGKVKLCKDLTEHAWVTAEEAKKYDLIEGIADEIEQFHRMVAIPVIAKKRR